MTTSFKTGDAVEWDHSRGTSRGKIEKKLTHTVKIKGHVAKASKAHPEYMVVSNKTGAEAIHRPEEMRKAKGGAGKGRKSPAK